MLRLLFVTLALAWGVSCRAAADRVEVLIIDGQNNHASTPQPAPSQPAKRSHYIRP